MSEDVFNALTGIEEQLSRIATALEDISAVMQAHTVFRAPSAVERRAEYDALCDAETVTKGGPDDLPF